jgi:uncharacterized protein YndB with AHSA1/START domain
MRKSTGKAWVKRGRRGTFARSVAFNASRESVFEAISTLAGLRCWWTPITGGSADAGGQLRFEFQGMDECIIMQVDRTERPRLVHWRCVMHTGLEEWTGTELRFELVQRASRACVLKFRHFGLEPRLACYNDCGQGWDHFLASLVGYVEDGKGMPFGSSTPGAGNPRQNPHRPPLSTGSRP